MPIVSERTVRFRCAACERLDTFTLSLFDLTYNEPKRFRCSCGGEGITFTVKKNKLLVEIFCPICLEPHTRTVELGRIWQRPLTALECTDMGTAIAFIGSKDALTDERLEVISSLEYDEELDVGDILGYDGPPELFADDFENSDATFRILRHVHEIADEGNVFCTCGSRAIMFELDYSTVSLRCEICGSIEDIQTGTDDDADEFLERKCVAIKSSGI